MTLADERAAAAARRWEERVERTARAALHAVGREASLRHTEAYIRETWAGLNDGQVEAVLARVGTMREEPARQRRLTPEEIEMALTEATKQTREAILGLLRQDPTLSTAELWERCQGRGIKLTAKSTFETQHAAWARKELGITPAKAGRAPKANHPWKKKAAAETAKAKAKKARPVAPARQPSEEVSPREAEAPPPPPAAPVAEAPDPATDWVPAGVRIVRERLEAELLRAQQRVTEIRIAIDVLEGLAA